MNNTGRSPNGYLLVDRELNRNLDFINNAIIYSSNSKLTSDTKLAWDTNVLKINVFKGNLNDHKTVIEQLETLKNEFGCERLIFVGDRGMKIKYNLDSLITY